MRPYKRAATGGRPYRRGKMNYQTKAGRAVVLALVLMLVATPVLAAMPWTRIAKLLVEDEAYVMGTLQVDGATSLTGAITASGGVDLNGSDLIIDADADSILDETSDDNIRMTLGAATGLFSVLTGNMKVGNGTPGVAQDGEDAYVEGTLEVDGAATFDGGATFATADLNGTALTIDADADTILDESADDVVGLTMGDAAGTFSVLTGNLKVGNGAPTVAQTGEDAYVEGIFEVDGLTYFDSYTYMGDRLYMWDNTIYLDSDSDITIAGSSDNLAVTTVAAGTVSVTTGNLKVGNGSPTIAQNGEDAYVEGQFEVDGEAQLDGALDANSTADFASTVAFNADTTMAADATGGNAGAKNEYIGLPRVRLVGIGVKDGAAEVEVDDSPAAEWAGIDGDVVDTADTTNYKIGANSLKLAFAATATAGDGATCATPGGDWTGFSSIGFWVYADKVFEAAQLVIYLTDATDPATFNTCAYATANVWQYCEVDITSLAGTQGDAVTDIDVRMAAGLPVAINIYIDQLVAWSATDEVALNVALQQDGDLGFINALSGAALDPSADYAIAYRAGVDSLVLVADLDPDGGFGLVAY